MPDGLTHAAHLVVSPLPEVNLDPGVPFPGPDEAYARAAFVMVWGLSGLS
jgi:hypothetical protein